jgi:hypothetical protein
MIGILVVVVALMSAKYATAPPMVLR